MVAEGTVQVPPPPCFMCSHVSDKCAPYHLRPNPGKIITELPTAQTNDRLNHIVRLTMSRNPSQSELKTLIAYYMDQKDRFSSIPGKAQLLVGDGQVPAGTTPAELAAWVSVARLLINLDEFINRE